MTRRWIIAVPVLLVVLVAGVGYVWHRMTMVRPVSVPAAVARFRAEQAVAGPAGSAGPARGVYVYDTDGTERISAGAITHTYPVDTTLTVVGTSCGMRVRWDALAERWMQWEICSAADGWHLRSFTDFHEFLGVDDRLDYVCTGAPLVLPAGQAETTLTATCTTATGRTVATIAVLGQEPVTVGGSVLGTTHLRVTSVGTGRSTASDVGELWISDAGLPLRVSATNHGEQVRAGVHISYDERISATLTTTTPLR